MSIVSFRERFQYILEGAKYDFYKDRIDTETFNKLVLLDPTHNKNYARWIVETYINLEKSSQGTARFNRFWEDAYKITEDLKIYDRFKNKKGYIEGDKRNILSIKTFSELASLVDTLPKEDAKDAKDNSLKPGKDFEKLYEDKEWLIVTPFTHLASCKYGAHTKWCTAATSSKHFDHYVKKGKLHIIINKIKNKKYQFHKESSQFLNEEDEKLTMTDKTLLRSIPEKAIEVLKEAGAPMHIFVAGDHDKIRYDLLDWLRQNYPKTVAKFFNVTEVGKTWLHKQLDEGIDIKEILTAKELKQLTHGYEDDVVDFISNNSISAIRNEYDVDLSTDCEYVVRKSVAEQLSSGDVSILQNNDLVAKYNNNKFLQDEMEDFFARYHYGKEFD